MYKYLDPQILSKIKPMELRARLVVEGLLTGLHKSPYHGFSLEFTEHRPYMPGDAPKRIDWKVYARRQRLYTKQFEEETNLSAYIILDASNSMSYSSDGISKFEYGAYLAASLSYLLINQKDAVSLTTFNSSIEDFLVPGSTKAHLGHIMNVLETQNTGGETDIASILLKLAARIKRRGLVILISDLLDKQEDVIHSLKVFKGKRNEVIVFHIMDSAEILFPFEDGFVFIDLEKNDEIKTGPEIRDSYLNELNRWCERYKTHLRSKEIDYTFINTSHPLENALLFYLAARKVV